MSVNDPGLSDHYALHFKICDKKPGSITKTKVTRKIQDIDQNVFKADILNTVLPLWKDDIISVTNYSNSVDANLRSQVTMLQLLKSVIQSGLTHSGTLVIFVKPQ